VRTFVVRILTAAAPAAGPADAERAA
jgi:hypothetical protein